MHPENNGNINPPKVINIELDSNRGNQPYTKSITIGELADSIITKDYSPHPMTQLRPPPIMQYRLDTNDVWKFNRSRTTPKEAGQLQQSAVQQMPPTSVNSQIKAPPNSKMVSFSIKSTMNYHTNCRD